MEHHAIRTPVPACVSGPAGMTYDARAVANCIIDLSLEYDQDLSHLSLQKILYFTHGRCLIEKATPLVSGHFEAWQYGPVHPAIYSAFKNTRGRRIIEHAKRLDPLTGRWSELDALVDKQDRLFVRVHAAQYMSLTAARLVDLSHANGSPWDVLTKRQGDERIYGDRITNDAIVALFHRHKISIQDQPLCGDPIDEQPPS